MFAHELRFCLSRQFGATSACVGAMLPAFGAGALVLSLVAYPLTLKMKKRRDREAVKDITGCEYNELEGAFQPATAAAN